MNLKQIEKYLDKPGPGIFRGIDYSLGAKLDQIRDGVQLFHDEAHGICADEGALGELRKIIGILDTMESLRTDAQGIIRSLLPAKEDDGK